MARALVCGGLGASMGSILLALRPALEEDAEVLLTFWGTSGSFGSDVKGNLTLWMENAWRLMGLALQGQSTLAVASEDCTLVVGTKEMAMGAGESVVDSLWSVLV